MDDPNASAGHSEQARILFGKYLVVRKLGEGAMGEVWLVRHRDLGAERALKLINLGRFSDPEMRARARREARAMGLFSHPNAVAVHDANADGDLAYIEMEYLRGASLNKVLEPGVPKPLEWVARMVEQLCAVLEVAHAHGIVHRDLKPANMMLLDSPTQGPEQLKILDFGIAKILHVDEQGLGHDDLQTRHGATIGTPAYMSPEQIDSDPNKIDGRSDLYSVGVILFEMLTGRRPFNSTSFKLTYDHLYTPPPHFADVDASLRIPPEVEKLVLSCLEKDPQLRPQSARELADEFRRLVKPPPVHEETTSTTKRRAFLLTLVVLLGVTVGVSAWIVGRPRPFSIRAAPSELSLSAGGSTTIALVADGQPPKYGGIQVDALPPGISLNRDWAQRHSGVDQFALRIDPNVLPGVELLSFHSTVGKSKKQATVRLTILPPKVEMPDGFSPLPGSRLVQDGGRIFHTQIVRDLGANAKLEFLFIKRTKSDEPASFYVMRDKVSNRVFARFAAKEPERLRDPAMWQKLEKEAPDLPAFNVSAEEACRFAHWLGRDRVKIRLPRVEQWDKASGYYDAKTQLGPFFKSWKPGDTTIAIDRDTPAPVGTSSHDESLFGCRDMAGNGYEWTRNSQIEGKMLPFSEDLDDPVLLRGQPFMLSRPFHYEDLKDITKRSTWRADDGQPYIGFRLVIDDL